MASALLSCSASASLKFATPQHVAGRRSGTSSSGSRHGSRQSRCVVYAAKSKGPKGFGKIPEEQQIPEPKPMPPPPQMMRAAAPPPPPENVSLPPIVSDRIIGRMSLFAGLPMVMGFASGPIAYYLKLVKGAEMEPAALYTVGTVLFGLAAVGITYGALSASWDPSRESDGLGLEDFKRNWPLAIEQLPFAKKRRS